MIRKQDYPPNWPEISLAVRTEAEWRCEWCSAPGGQVIKRDNRGKWIRVMAAWAPGSEIREPTEGMSWARLKFHGLTKVVLTVAHLDRNSKNNERSNLAALCQRCHLRHDIRQHIANRKYGRLHAKEQQGRLDL